jgi:hypothetical protein
MRARATMTPLHGGGPEFDPTPREAPDRVDQGLLPCPPSLWCSCRPPRRRMTQPFLYSPPGDGVELLAALSSTRQIPSDRRRPLGRGCRSSLLNRHRLRRQVDDELGNMVGRNTNRPVGARSLVNVPRIRDGKRVVMSVCPKSDKSVSKPDEPASAQSGKRRVSDWPPTAGALYRPGLAVAGGWQCGAHAGRRRSIGGLP